MLDLVEGPSVEKNIYFQDISTQPHQKYDADIAFLHRFGIGMPTLQLAQSNGQKFRISASQALIASGGMSETDYYRCVAFELGLEFTQSSPPSTTPLYKLPSPDILERMARMVQVGDDSGVIHLAPDCRQMPALKALLLRNPKLAERLKITTLSNNKKSIEERGAPSTLRLATDGLREKFPSFSARQVISVPQAIILTLVLQALILVSLISSGGVLLMLHLIASSFYLGCTALRLTAAVSYQQSQRCPLPLDVPSSQVDESELPIYSVLVALYQEAGQVDDLVDSLLALDWPKQRLEIKLVCEADDKETIIAVRAALLRVKSNAICLVEVPPNQPRTKPKALNYALPLCQGRLLVIYDAEDRPDPLQLKEAYYKFKKGPDNLGCLQAPLVIYNHNESWFSRMFAIEYSSLFDGLLPMLTRAKAPLPLGGTSNHFKRSILEKIGAWDPYNVTEDADLGVRLARSGYQIDTIRRATFEEAPINYSVWLKQRTRWFKGWFQTWLVHMRHPIALSRDLGFMGTVVFHLMITGMIVSALVHPILLYFIAARSVEIYTSGASAVMNHPLIALDLATILFGYGAFAALAWRTLPVRKLSKLRWALWGIPLYWMLLSIASWRALWHLIRRPHEWEKTPHRLRKAR